MEGNEKKILKKSFHERERKKHAPKIYITREEKSTFLQPATFFSIHSCAIAEKVSSFLISVAEQLAIHLSAIGLSFFLTLALEMYLREVFSRPL